MRLQTFAFGLLASALNLTLINSNNIASAQDLTSTERRTYRGMVFYQCGKKTWFTEPNGRVWFLCGNGKPNEQWQNWVGISSKKYSGGSKPMAIFYVLPKCSSPGEGATVVYAGESKDLRKLVSIDPSIDRSMKGMTKPAIDMLWKQECGKVAFGSINYKVLPGIKVFGYWGSWQSPWIQTPSSDEEVGPITFP